MMQKSLTDKIYYIGVDDKEIDLFEGQYVVPNGISYNSYVIMDEKIAIMDTVDIHKAEEWLSNLKDVLKGKAPHYLVVLHMEPDHAGSIKQLVEQYPSIQIVSNQKAFQMMEQFFENLDVAGRSYVVKEGDVLSLGEHSLTFVTAPMVNWHEVMVA